MNHSYQLSGCSGPMSPLAFLKPARPNHEDCIKENLASQSRSGDNSYFQGRRSFIAGGLGALVSSSILNWQTLATAANSKQTRPMSCILLWMNGGPSHIDTFDPKPDSKTGGPFKIIKTKNKSLQICEHLPQIADQADKLAVIRSMTTKEGNHDRGRYLMHTGYAPSVTLQHPSFGSWVSRELGGNNAELPKFVCIRGGSVGAGFLGVEHAPLTVQDPSQGLNNLHRAKDIDGQRFQQRQDALQLLQNRFSRQTGLSRVNDLSNVYAKAQRLMNSEMAKAFDLSSEPEMITEAYGKTPFGQGCLMARRLIESGIRFVEVTLDGWDTHVDNFSQTKSLCQELDPAYAMLLKELEERQLLESTLVIWMGEFGRSPRISRSEGRDHHPHAWTAVLAGGRVRANQVYGSSDEQGAKVVERPMTVPNYFATLSALMGIDPTTEVMSPVGRPISISENGKTVRQLIS